MPIFHIRAAKSFEAALRQLFTPAGLYFVYTPDADALATCYHTYTQAFVANGATKALGVISQADAGIVPYLSLRANLLINGQTQPLDIIPADLRRELPLLDGPATPLTPVQALYLQLFRGLFAGRQFLLMADFPTSMTPPDKRYFLNVADKLVRQTGSSLILLTQDQNLITAHPDTSWWAAPTLTTTVQPN
ncbi:hypothetical protein [Lacticaseibacillus absianus]|uniref:hypothetical protein n=1 Tax=Lacticaseibacillus absianus TaxID=2729623 RepID=UPI0015CD0FC9|nr:hypothetical protein [Lacticaseibacillus absianus]